MALWGKRGSFGITLAISTVFVGVLVYWVVTRLLPLLSGETKTNPNAVAESDPRMVAARAEALRRWPEFVDLYQHRNFGQRFFVKAKFSEGRTTEWLWVQVDLLDGIKGKTITGTVDTQATRLVTAPVGSSVKFTTDNIADWKYENGPDVRGEFSGRVMDEVAKERGLTTQPAVRGK